MAGMIQFLVGHTHTVGRPEKRKIRTPPMSNSRPRCLAGFGPHDEFFSIAITIASTSIQAR